MSQTKKQYSPQFNAKVALEAVEGVKTVSGSGEWVIVVEEIGSQFHPLGRLCVCLLKMTNND